MIESWFGVENEWSPFPEKHGTNVERCSGVETRQPLHYFEKNRVYYSFELNKEMIDMEDFCDSEWVMKKVDPRLVYTPPLEKRQKHVVQRLIDFDDVIWFIENWDIYYLKSRLELNSQIMQNMAFVGFYLQGAVFNYITAYSNLKSYCEEKWPDFNGPAGKGSAIFYENCALAHAGFLGDQDIIENERTVFDHSNHKRTDLLANILKGLGYCL